jgi:hypothetical protein
MALALNSAANAVLPQSVGHAVHSVKGMWTEKTATGNLTLDATYSSKCKIDPGGAHRDVTLEAVSLSSGVERVIVNGADAAENLVLKNVGGDTIGTVNQNEAGVFYCDGSSWYLIYTYTIALT